MTFRSWNLAVLVALSTLWLASGTQREKRVVPEGQAVALYDLETHVATHPGDREALRSLAQGYLDVKAPGLAMSVIASAPDAVRRDPHVEHVYARALLEQGRAADALAAERRVLGACNAGACEPWLSAAATRRSEILEELVSLGIEDANAHPEMSAVAYQRATREARLSVR